VATVTVIYILVIAFKTALILGAGGAIGLRFGPAEFGQVPDDEMPTYTVLVPLLPGGNVLADLVPGWPGSITRPTPCRCCC